MWSPGVVTAVPAGKSAKYTVGVGISALPNVAYPVDIRARMSGRMCAESWTGGYWEDRIPSGSMMWRCT